jgi:pyridoxal phosphate enzyme (YggS family)
MTNSINLNFGLRPEEIERNLARDDEIFFEGNRKSPIFEKKRSSDKDKVPEDQGDESKTQVIKNVLEKIEVTAKKCGRDSSRITLVAVTKKHSLEECLPLLEEKVVDFGENRLEEAFQKMEEAPLTVKWHFIGSLQRKKVPKVIGKFCLIHSVDTFELAEKISQCSENKGIKTPILLQVNTSGEESKQGFSVDELKGQFSKCLELKGVEIQGLMTMAPLTEDKKIIRETFALLREVKNDLERFHPLPHLSMGMSHDFEIAIEEGATLLRIGSLLFKK